MINHLKINNFEFTADNRAYAKISGLEPTDVAVDLISAGGHKKITGSTRDNRIIQITGVVVDVSFIKDIYKHLVVGNEYEIEVGTDDSEKRFYTDGIVTEIIVDRYKLPVTYTVKITCTSAYLYGKITTYGGAEAVDVSLENEYDIPQTAIKISHTIAANEETVTFNFFGTTTVNVGTDNVDLELILDLEKQTCTIGGINRFYLVSEWADGAWGASFSIPANTTVLFREKVLGVF